MRNLISTTFDTNSSDGLADHLIDGFKPQHGEPIFEIDPPVDRKVL